MSIQAIGYLGVGSDKVDDWTAFAVNWLGMQVVDRGAGQRAFRMDDRKQRLAHITPKNRLSRAYDSWTSAKILEGPGAPGLGRTERNCA